MSNSDLVQFPDLSVQQDVLSILDHVLHLQGRAASFNRGTPLLGALPELDSQGVVVLLTAFEERLGIVIEDDEMDGATFQTVGTLVDYVSRKLEG